MVSQVRVGCPLSVPPYFTRHPAAVGVSVVPCTSWTFPHHVQDPGPVTPAPSFCAVGESGGSVTANGTPERTTLSWREEGSARLRQAPAGGGRGWKLVPGSPSPGEGIGGSPPCWHVESERLVCFSFPCFRGKPAAVFKLRKLQLRAALAWEPENWCDFSWEQPRPCQGQGACHTWLF